MSAFALALSEVDEIDPNQLLNLCQLMSKKSSMHPTTPKNVKKFVPLASSIGSSSHSSLNSLTLEDLEQKTEVADITATNTTPARDLTTYESQEQNKQQHKSRKSVQTETDTLQIIYEGRDILKLEANLRQCPWQFVSPLRKRDSVYAMNICISVKPYLKCSDD